MYFGRCRGCDAHKQEIAHLLGQIDRMASLLEKSQARVIEAVAPGATGRATMAERYEKAPPPRPRPVAVGETFPGYPPPRPKPEIVVEDGVSE